MPSEVILPRVDMDMATGKISKWLVASGTAVAKGQPLFEIETDKATMEIEAEVAGTIRDLAEVGSTDIAVGSVVAWIFGENETATAPPQATPTTADPAMAGAQAASAAASPALSAAPASTTASNGRSDHGRQRATPLARRLARMDGIDLGSLTGSGPRGRIQAADVAVPSRPATTPAPAEARRAPPPPAPEPTKPAPSPAAASGSASEPAGLTRLRDGTGRPVLLVHGFGADANGWRPFLRGQSLERPVFGLDLPGHGSAPLGGIKDFDDLVDAVEAAIGEIDGADVVAHSLGGAVMTAVAARGQADLRSLLLIAPAGLGPEINGSFIQGFLAATSEAALSPWMAELVADPAVMTAAFVRSTLKLRAGTDRVETQYRLAASLFPDGTQSISIRADLAKLRLPTRVIFGTADRIIPARQAAGLPGLVALHLLPGVGHMPHMEAPETVAAILAQITRL